MKSNENEPMTMQMIGELCGNDSEKRKEIEAKSQLDLERRIAMQHAIKKQ